MGHRPPSAKPISTTARAVAAVVAAGDLMPSSLRPFQALLPPKYVESQREILYHMHSNSPLPIVLTYLSTLVRFFLSLFDWFAHDRLRSGVLRVVLRKRLIHDEVIEAIHRGATQVLVMGAGADVLCWNLSQQFRHVLFVEIDHPSTLMAKQQSVQKMSKKMPTNLHLIGVDFRNEAIEDALERELPEWQNGALSLVVAEGLFMYLNVPAIIGCLQTIRRITGSGSSLIFEYCTKVDADRLIWPSWLTRFALNLFDEPLKWLPENRQDVLELIEGEMFTADLESPRTDVFARYLPGTKPIPPFIGLATFEHEH